MMEFRTALKRHNNPLFWLLIGVFFTLSVPSLFPRISQLEGRILPVTTSLDIIDPEVIEGGISFFVKFNKLRQCDFLGMAWYAGDRRLVVNFSPQSNRTFPTRPTGAQYAGPWMVEGIDDLTGTKAVTFHRCNDFWTTVTSVYP